jgi:NAD(P)-dependent dehydrogenase (short-subunit alcohol dehydrogenase family)
MVNRQVALVTGASSGIGFAVAELLARRGFNTFGTSRNLDRTKGPEGVEMLRLDVTSDESVRAAMAKITDRAGHVDVLVNNAGFGLFGAVEETSIDEAKAQFETNFWGIVRMTSNVLEPMRKRQSGRVINISSVLGFMAIPFHPYYVAAKHALEGYSEALSLELQPFGVHVILVEPAYTRSLYFDHRQETKARVQAYAAERGQVISLMAERIRNGSSPESVATVVLKAVMAHSPGLRYTAGFGGIILKLGYNLLPTSVFDAMVQRAFALR